jgi:hypothetical protein
MQEDIDIRTRFPEDPTETEFDRHIESEYRRNLVALNRTGILSILPDSERLGVIGFDGREYPVPTQEEVKDVISRNNELVKTKEAQGFTRLQITPMAAPIPILIARAETEILKHAREGAIFQSKQSPHDQDIAVDVDKDEPVWVWNRVKEAISANEIVYFPHQFEGNHKGKTKGEIVNDPSVCAVPGWSLGLIEDTTRLPRQGQGKDIGGRSQLENNLTPKDYLKSLHQATYLGETGWTYEDFLTDFLVNLQNTNQVSHESYEYSALWLVGSYLPSSASVPDGSWDRGNGRLYVSAYDPDFRAEGWGVRSTVRLKA